MDVLPAGPAILAAGRLDWPDGSSMNMTGFGHALSCSSPRDLGGGLIVPVARLELLALLKIIAYLDRPVERERDLEDLAYLLGSYVDDDDERLWTETPYSLDFHDGPSWLLGVDLGRRIEGREYEQVEAFLGMARSKGGAHATAARMARHLPLKLRLGEDSEPEDILRGLLKSFEDGLRSTRSE